MTIDNYNHIEKTVHSSLFQNLTLIFAGLTLFFAVFLIIIGNRLSTLRADHLNSLKENVSLETASTEEIRIALENAKTNLEASKQAAETEKKNAEKLRQQLSATQKELEKVKADLVAANQTITGLKTALPAKPATSVGPSNPAALPNQGLPTEPPLPQGQLPAPQNAPPTPQQPAPPALPDQTPETAPENQAPKPPAPVSENNAGSSPPPSLVRAQPSQTKSPAAEETISDATHLPSPQPTATE
jgi:hypothetical protein